MNGGFGGTGRPATVGDCGVNDIGRSSYTGDDGDGLGVAGFDACA